MASCSCPEAQNLKNLTCWVQVDGGHDADDDANGDDDDDADKDDEDGVDDDVSNYTDVKEVRSISLIRNGCSFPRL